MGSDAHLYRRARGRVAAARRRCADAFFLLFQTSLPWALAAPLRLSESPRPADAIVVFAGGVGESGPGGRRISGARQDRRSICIAPGFAPRMIFESGYVFAFREAEIMRDLAISLGVPPSAIVLETHGANTYDDVIRVRDLASRSSSGAGFCW